MLAHEWRELETLCERISETRHRLVAAQRTQNAGLVEGLKDDLAKARRHREALVQHISARLGSAAASAPERAAAARQETPSSGPGTEPAWNEPPSTALAEFPDR